MFPTGLPTSNKIKVVLALILLLLATIFYARNTKNSIF